LPITPKAKSFFRDGSNHRLATLSAEPGDRRCPHTSAHHSPKSGMVTTSPIPHARIPKNAHTIAPPSIVKMTPARFLATIPWLNVMAGQKSSPLSITSGVAKSQLNRSRCRHRPAITSKPATISRPPMAGSTTPARTARKKRSLRHHADPPTRLGIKSPTSVARISARIRQTLRQRPNHPSGLFEKEQVQSAKHRSLYEELQYRPINGTNPNAIVIK